MIARLTSDQLRMMADQLDAWTHLVASGGPRPGKGRTLNVGREEFQSAAYLHWWEDGRRYMAEIVSFCPQGEVPLIWHGGST